jgi:DNA-binding NtrC family response regulator
MQDILAQAQRAAATDATVLIQGESGTGKELIAEAIHRSSDRRAKPFVTINMAAVPDTLIESELFGHREGAFTGAGTSRTGRFESADGGTIFIDEIGDLKLASQSKLLRVLETHSVTPVGGNDDRQVDVRVLAATNRNLERMVAEGEFREDLYYRLNVVSLVVPPLRDRRSDIGALIDHYLDRICRGNDKSRPMLSDELMEYLEQYRWPGNIRQLRNCIESMIVLSSSDRLGIDDLPEIVRQRDESSERMRLDIPDHFSLEDVERVVVMQTLDDCHGNRTQAARSLGISVRTLQRRLKQWRIGQNGNGRALPGAAVGH